MMRDNHPFLTKGPDHPAAKLTAEKREDIRVAYREGAPVKRIATDFGVCVATVYRVLKE